MTVQILELFGGVGAPRAALRNLGADIKSIDYVEIDPSAVRSYNAMFKDDLPYKPQNVIGWNLKPDILIHGSPCQDVSIAGHQRGNDEGSGTRSSLMWETIKIIQNMGIWKPRVVIWENVKGVLSRSMIRNFSRYCDELQKLGYTTTYQVLDARDYGIPQARQRCFTVSMLDGHLFNFQILQKQKMKQIDSFLLPDDSVPHIYDVVQPSVLSCIGKHGIRRATVIQDYAMTITCRQDRTPAQIIYCGGNRYRYLTERECWRLQGYSDEDFNAAESVTPKHGRYRMDLYRQAGNSIAVPVLEAIFKEIL